MQFCKLLMMRVSGFIPLIQLERGNSEKATIFFLMRNMRSFVVLILYAFIETNRKSNWWKFMEMFSSQSTCVLLVWRKPWNPTHFDGDYSISLKQIETSCSFDGSIWPMSTSWIFIIISTRNELSVVSCQTSHVTHTHIHHLCSKNDQIKRFDGVVEANADQVN